MWFDTQRTKDIAAMLDLVEVGANNGWMQPSTGQYFDECLERDEKAITLLTPCQKRDLGLDDTHTPNDPSSATRPTGRVDCNSDAMAGFAAAHG